MKHESEDAAEEKKCKITRDLRDLATVIKWTVPFSVFQTKTKCLAHNDSVNNLFWNITINLATQHCSARGKHSVGRITLLVLRTSSTNSQIIQFRCNLPWCSVCPSHLLIHRYTYMLWVTKYGGKKNLIQSVLRKTLTSALFKTLLELLSFPWSVALLLQEW